MVSNGEVADEADSDSPESFSRTILVMIEDIISRNHGMLEDVEGFGIAVGPGSFTGIRIGLATLSGICLSRNIPVFGVSTLEAMALSSGYSGDGVLAPMLDAGQENVYYGLFKKNGDGIERLSPDSVGVIDEIISETGNSILAFGEGAEVYRKNLEKAGVKVVEDTYLFSTSAGVALLAEKMGVAKAESDIFRIRPNYMHRSSINYFPLILED